MLLGDFTMPLHPPGAASWTDTLDMDIERLATLDELGYHETWLGEHYTSRWENIPAPDLIMARLIPETRTMKLCTGVTCMPSHNPFHLAHRIAQLDQMLKGRFMWGVGPGGFPGDILAAGFDLQSGRHREMARQAIDMVLKLWEDPTPGRYKNEFWDFTITEAMDDVGMAFHVKPCEALPAPPSPHSRGGLPARVENPGDRRGAGLDPHVHQLPSNARRQGTVGVCRTGRPRGGHGASGPSELAYRPRRFRGRHDERGQEARVGGVDRPGVRGVLPSG